MDPALALPATQFEGRDDIARTSGEEVAGLGAEPGPVWMRVLAFLVGLLPYRWLGPLGRMLGWFAGDVLGIRRAHVESSMRASGIASPPDAAAAMYASLGTGLFELLWFAARPADEIDRVTTVTAEAARSIEQHAGKGFVIATAHTGNWDLGACGTARFLARANTGARAGPRYLHVVTKRLTWRALDRYWQHVRARVGVRLIDARGAMKPALAALRRGDAVAMLIDQAPTRRGGTTRFPFLGREANHDLVIATVAARAEVPILVAFPRRAPDGRHALDVCDVIPPPRSRAEVLAATMRLSAALDRFVREHPSQWLWLHRRWKQPNDALRQPGLGMDERA